MPTGIYPRPSPEVRFQRFFNKTEGCWVWQGSLSGEGYGQFSLGGKCTLAHRYSYEIAKGNIPRGLVIDHLCRNPSCVNPSHLECVKMAENTRRGLLHIVIKEKWAAKTLCKRGHPFSGDNLMIDYRGKRQCKACQRMKANEWKVRHRGLINARQRQRRQDS